MGLFGKGSPPGPTQAELRVTQLEIHVEEAETRYLEVLRREIANALIQSDPRRFERAYLRGCDIESELSRAPASRVHAEEQVLLERYTSYTDFDLLGTWHVVPYDQARDMSSDDDLVERYHDICRMILLHRRRDERVKGQPLFNERERKSQVDTLRKHLDKGLKVRIEHAMQLYYAYRHGLETGSGEAFLQERPVFRNAELEVFDLPNEFDEGRYGIAFTKTGEFGAYGYLVHDDGRIGQHYYATDASFGTLRYLMV